MKYLTLFFTLTILASAGFLLSEETATVYEGTYTVQCKNLTSDDEYTEEIKIYGPMSGTYVVECTYGDDFSSGDGIEFNKMLFAYNTAIGYPLSVYKKEGSELYGLVVTEDYEIIQKSTKGECPLELSHIDSTLAGMYVAEGAADDKSFFIADTMILEPEEDMWEVSQVVHTQGFEDQPGSIEPVGSGFQTDRMLVLSYYDDGMSFLKIYPIDKQVLEGRWVVYYWDFENNCAVVTTGWEKANKLESD
ncbi:hypothetical protein JXM67_03235 [candidate division WOR-3 bacterium]|nr:hypothetical protein [candidate division WOR-3 bacterium]